MAKNNYRAKAYTQNLAEDVLAKPIAANIEIKPTVLYKVQVTHPSLRRRAEPSTDSEVLGLITDMGEYEIFAEVGGWGKLKDNSWIMLQFCHKIKED